MLAEQNHAEFLYKNVSVTGGTGTVASQFIKVLLAQFPSVERITTAYRNPHSERVKRIPDSPIVNAVIGNIADPLSVSEIVAQGEVVYHLAGWLANTSLPDDWNEVYITNSLSTGMLAKLCARQDKRFVFTSSHSVYFAGEYKGRIREDTFGFREDFVDWIDTVKSEYYRYMDDLLEHRADFRGASQALAAIHRSLPPPFDPKIYDNDGYHIYCLTKLLAERFALDHGGIVLRLSNVYGPGDDSVQAVGEACHRILEADPKKQTTINQPFKKLVPAYLGDIIKSLVRAGVVRLPANVSPVFTLASQEDYLKEDALLRMVSAGLNEIRGTNYEYDIEQLPVDDPPDFTYDLSKLKAHILYGEELTPFGQGLRAQLAWLMARQNGEVGKEADVTIDFFGGEGAARCSRAHSDATS